MVDEPQGPAASEVGDNGRGPALANLARRVVAIEAKALEDFRALGATPDELRAAEASIIWERGQWARQAGLTFGGLRDEYAILGYDQNVSDRQYRAEYARGGIAGAIVDVMPDACWRGSMEIIEDQKPKDDTPFEAAWKILDVRLQIQAKFRIVDKLSRLSTFAVLLIGVTGDVPLDQELPKGTGKPDDVIFLRPYSGGGSTVGGQSRQLSAIDARASVSEYETNPGDRRFGRPKMYTLKTTDFQSPMDQRQVHWSRVIHVAEGLLDDDVFGMPALERVWNLLIDLRKVTGGGAEAFWLRANQGLHLDIAKDMKLLDVKDTNANLKEQSEAYKHQMTRWLRTRGVTVTPLGSDVANFQSPADAILTQISGATRIPKRILTGSEMGELASSQDRDNWKDNVNGRQTSQLGPYLVRPFVNRLINYNYLPSPAKEPNVYEVRWPHIETLTETEKASGAKSWADTNVSMKGAGLNPAFTDAEIRLKWYGMQALTPEEIAKAMSAAPAIAVPAAAVPADIVAAEDAELLRVLEAAIVAGNADVIDRVIGMRLGDLAVA